MQNLYKEVASLDQRCYKQLALSEEILMEHAAEGMNQYIRSHFPENSIIQIVCGAGNNGADGIALARLLHQDYRVRLYLPHGVKSPMAQLQFSRTQALQLRPSDVLDSCDVLVDALFGSGFSRTFDTETFKLLQAMNSLKAYKIACDIPSGLHLNGKHEKESFIADVTLSMGALKLAQFSDAAKDIVGEIKVIDLGISRSLYEMPSNLKILEESDLSLPLRKQKNSHKGSFGHLSVICGEKEGAAVIAGSAALRFGSGLVTLVSNEKVQLPYELMLSHLLPTSTTAIALGMGLGQEFSESELTALLTNAHPLVLDADIFAHPLITKILDRQDLVITPHPKEFVTLLKTLKLADIDTATLQKNRFHYAELFAQAYSNVVLVLKGANVIIAYKETFYINPLGSNALAKGGSGDVLSGLIGALLAQGYHPLEASIQASLAHTLSAKTVTKNNYALTPFDLIENLCNL